MNDKDRRRLERLQRAIESIPFPQDGSGTKTAGMSGYISFQNDMRAVRSIWSKVLYGACVEQFDGWEVGYDYDDPDLLLDALEKWIEQRKAENWGSTTPYSFSPFYEDAKTKMREA